MSRRASPRSSELRNSEEMYRQSSRTANSTGDAIDCLITTDDLVNESDFLPEQTKSHRRSNSRYQHEYSSRRSPVTSSRSYQTRPYRQRDEREHRYTSPSTTRKSSSVKKRHHSPSRSPHERGSSQKYSTASSSATSKPQYKSKRSDRRESHDHIKQELSVISEDELTKIAEQRNEQTSLLSVQTQSTPIESTNISNSKDQLPETSAVNQLANSTLNEPKHGPNTIPPTSSHHNILDSIEMIHRYQNLVSFSSNDPTVLAFRQNVKELIEKHLELEKRSQAERERAIRLQEIESAEKEKQNIKQSGKDECSEPQEQVIVKPNNNCEATTSLRTSEIANVPVAEINKSVRRNGAPTRFSRSKVDPSTSLYPGDDDVEQVKSTNGSADLVLHADLKIISSNSSREVRIQHGNNEPTNNPKDLTEDLRSTLNNNRTKSVTSEENDPDSNENLDQTPTMVGNGKIETMNHEKIAATSSSYSDSNSKQADFEYGGQGNLSAASDNDQNDREMKKTEDRAYQNRYSNIKRRPHHYSGQHPSASTNFTPKIRTETSGRDYFSGYAPVYKGHKNDDLRSRLNGNRHPKGSMYRNH